MMVVPALEPTASERRLAAVAKALGHPARVRIVRLIAERGECVTGELVDAMPLAQSTVSEHLRILRAAGVLQGEVDGDRPHYCIDLEAVRSFLAELAGIGGLREEAACVKAR